MDSGIFSLIAGYIVISFILALVTTASFGKSGNNKSDHERIGCLWLFFILFPVVTFFMFDLQEYSKGMPPKWEKAVYLANFFVLPACFAIIVATRGRILFSPIGIIKSISGGTKITLTDYKVISENGADESLRTKLIPIDALHQELIPLISRRDWAEHAFGAEKVALKLSGHRDGFIDALPPSYIALPKEITTAVTTHGSARFSSPHEMVNAGLFANNGLILGKSTKVKTQKRLLTCRRRYSDQSLHHVQLSYQKKILGIPIPRTIQTELPFPRISIREVEIEQTEEVAEDAFLRMNNEGHIAVIAPPGAGKTSGLIIPNMLSYSGSMFVTDIKGEIYDVTGSRGTHEVHVLDPFQNTRADQRSGIDLLSYIDREFLSEDCDAMAAAILPMPIGTKEEDKYWIEGARELISSFIAFAVVNEKLPEEKRNIGQVRDWLMKEPDQLEALLKTLSKHENRHIREGAIGFVSAPEKTRGSMLRKAQVGTNFLRSEKVVATLSAKESKLCDFSRMQTEKLSVYLSVPDKYLDSHAAFVRLVIECLLMSLKLEKKGGLKPTFLLDEFCNLGKMDKIAQRLSNTRELCHVMLIAQSVGQIKGIYGDNGYRTMMDCCNTQVYISPSDFETQKELSERLGKATIHYYTSSESTSASQSESSGTSNSVSSGSSYSNSQGVNQGESKTNNGLFSPGSSGTSDGISHTTSEGYNHSVSEGTSESRSVSESRSASQNQAVHARELLTPDEIASLPPDVALIIMAGKALRPIKAKRINYYNDPAFEGVYTANRLYS